MKRKWIVTLFTLLLLLVSTIVTAMPVNAAARIKGYVEITYLQQGVITFNYGWDKLNAYYYEIIIQNQELAQTIYDSGIVGLEYKTPVFFDQMTFFSGDLVAGYTYTVTVVLFTKHLEQLNNGYLYDLAYLGGGGPPG